MDNYYRTKDLAEGSVLLVKQKKLVSIDREGKTCWFIFEEKKSCEQIANQFWFGSCLVNAKSYFDAIQTLKNRIFAV